MKRVPVALGHTVPALLLPGVGHAQGFPDLGLVVEQMLGCSGSGKQLSSGFRGMGGP